MKKGIIKLFHANGKIKINSHIQFRSTVCVVNTLTETHINGVLPFVHCKLLKYHVVNGRGKIGELSYECYEHVGENDKVEVETSTILEKMELGDEVRITKLDGKLFKELSNSNAKSITGVITNIKGRNATISVFGNGYPDIVVKRYRFVLTNRSNTRVLCKLV